MRITNSNSILLACKDRANTVSTLFIPTGCIPWCDITIPNSKGSPNSAWTFSIKWTITPRVDGLNADFIDIREEYGATATLMSEYLRAAGVKLSPRLATALFYAIKTGTDNFVRATTSRDMIAFRYLYESANLNIIKKIESSEITRHTLAWFQQAMRQLVFVNDLVP